MQTCFINLPDAKLYVQQAGNGIPLVLLHAGFSDLREWKFQFEVLAKNFNTIAYDQRGFGQSSNINNAYSPAYDLKLLLDKLQFKKVFLIGHSLGGTIALDFALQYPENVSGIILLASGLNGYDWSSEYTAFMTKIWTLHDPASMANQFLSAPCYSQSMTNPSINTTIMRMVTENFSKALTWGTFAINDVRWYHPHPNLQLKKLLIPVQVIYGNNDSIDIKNIANCLSSHIPNCKTNVITADHFLNMDKANQLNDIILGFFASLKGIDYVKDHVC